MKSQRMKNARLIRGERRNNAPSCHAHKEDGVVDDDEKDEQEDRLKCVKPDMVLAVWLQTRKRIPVMNPRE
jgi:hypothetical protein